MAYDLAQLRTMRLGAASALACAWLGFPCAAGGWATAFRCTCVGYFTCSALPLVLGEGSLSRRLLRASLLIHSVSAWLVSWLWCLGFAEWCILMVLVQCVQLFALLVLVGTHLQFHLLFTLLGSLLAYVGRREVAEQAAQAQLKTWAVCLVFVVSSLVLGMWCTHHHALQFLQKKLQVLYSIVKMPEAVAQDLDEITRVCSAMSSSSSRGSAEHSPIAVSGWIDGLELGKRVGKGSFGTVYYCKWQDAPAAVKVMTVNLPCPIQPNSSKSRRKERNNPFQEAQLCAKLSHPNLVRSFQSCTRDMNGLTEMWIIQEWCDRGTLSAHCNISRCDPPGCRHVKALLKDILSAACHLHSFGIIHGDLTANNVLLQSTTADMHRDFVCKVCDFGLSRVLEEGKTELFTSQLGTVSHMPPELLQLEKKSLSKKADVYATGILLYQALMGEPPYQGMSAAQVVLYVAQGNMLHLRPGVSQDLSRAFEQCTRRRPADRPEARQLLTELQLPSLPGWE
ncbi:unnamed protein product [Effrenium voratum]|nr:unnamed protein product [Effrenium voratum]